MNAATESRLNELLNLPAADRIEILEALRASLMPDDAPPLSEQWLAVVRERAKSLADGSVVEVPWEEVERQADEISRG